MPNLLQRYHQKLEAEGWSADPEQLSAVKRLGQLLKELKSFKKSWMFWRPQTLPKGVYMYGGVGRGKSMLMDLFYDEAMVKLGADTKIRRVHFHEFMIETHDWLHHGRGDNMADLLPRYAAHVAAQTHIICFDEFHVTDVADAMILGRLFTALFDQNVVMVSTSNWAPNALYEGGLQRDLFLPFIALLQTKCDIVHLDSETDYRQLSDPDQDVYYFHPLSQVIQQKIDRLFSELSKGVPLRQEKIEVKGREIKVSVAQNCARFSFAALCEQPLGAEDYIKIAKTYDTVFVEKIPRLTYDRRNETKRLILLIDCLYEAKCRVVISAQEAIENIYHGDDHAFEFDRTISRLMEMQSLAYHADRVQAKGAGL